MEHWTDGYVKANGIRIHYYRTGGDNPPIVLNHGAMDDGLCWTRVAKELEHAYDLIMIDARGHGLSDSGKGDYSSEARAKDLAQAIVALGLEKPVVGGHSLGAECSMYLAAEYPEIPRAIFLEDPIVTLPGEPTFGGKLAENEERAIKMMQRVLNLYKILPLPLGKLLARKMMPVAPEDEIVPWILSKKRMDKDFFRSLLESGAPLPDPFEVAKGIRVPTLLLMGDRDRGAIVSPEAAEQLAESIPGLQIAHLKGANHDVRRTKFEAYMTTLCSFLDEVHR